MLTQDVVTIYIHHFIRSTINIKVLKFRKITYLSTFLNNYMKEHFSRYMVHNTSGTGPRDFDILEIL